MPPLKLQELERSLNNVYLRIYREIRKDENYPGKYWMIRPKFERQVYDSTRAALSQVQQIGAESVNRKTKTDFYPTTQDIELIKQQTQKTVDSFWRKILLEIQRIFEGKETDTKAYLEIVAISAITGTFALSTKSKINQIVQLAPILVGGAISLTNKPVFKWIARLDEKTCIELPNGDPGCGALNGTFWAMDDPTIPIPGELGSYGTHPHCRCFLDLIMPDDPRYPII